MRLELGSEVIDSLVTFAIHPIPEADPGKVAEWLNVFTSLLSDIFLADKKKINPLVLLQQESVVVLVEAVVLVC